MSAGISPKFLLIKYNISISNLITALKKTTASSASPVINCLCYFLVESVFIKSIIDPLISN